MSIAFLLCLLSVQSLEAFAQSVERSCDGDVLFVRFQLQRNGPLPFQEGQLDVICEEEQLMRIRRHVWENSARGDGGLGVCKCQELMLHRIRYRSHSQSATCARQAAVRSEARRRRCRSLGSAQRDCPPPLFLGAGLLDPSASSFSRNQDTQSWKSVAYIRSVGREDNGHGQTPTTIASAHTTNDTLCMHA